MSVPAPAVSEALRREVERRRTFAIISHPDAGKTTLTEKTLLYAGAIELAGAVKGRASQRHVVSDWMDIERERGISITSAALEFDLLQGHIEEIEADDSISVVAVVGDRMQGSPGIAGKVFGVGDVA